MGAVAWFCVCQTTDNAARVAKVGPATSEWK
jgi:hypothetical protein